MMQIDEVRDFCLALPGTTEDFPFDRETLAFRIGGKIYALMNIEVRPLRINLKCTPDRAEELRAEHPEIIPGYHMNKRHWNTVGLEAGLDDELCRELIRHSYELVLAGLPKKLQDEISRETS
ncbi:MAG: MmcQ/YjbR family DNA-binding protein [Bacteroidia bacterium]